MMNNYKKGILSLATALALSSSAVASSYLPLTSVQHDNRWVLFGINGFKIDGKTSDINADFTNWGDPADTHITDNVIDEVGVSGFRATAGDPTTNMAEIKALNLSSGALTSITVNFNSTAETYSETEPTRTMYFKAQGNDYADAMLTYKASLEGKTLEFQYNGDTTKTYTVTISSLNTFDNPATRVIKSPIQGNSGEPLDTISLAMDFDLLDNPQNPDDYVRVANTDNPVGYQTANSSASVRMYRYNAVNSSWEIYDSANSELANDFTDLKRGKAYWSKVDLDNNDLSEQHTRAGLVLGDSGLVNADYNGSVAAGWNLMSFDGAKPNIRTSNTGMILEDLKQGGTIDILDSTGVNSVTVDWTGNSTQEDAESINLAIESAKAKGLFNDVFDLRAFRVGDSHILLISNKKFSVKDNGNSEIGTGTTMAGKGLWDMASNTLLAAGADVPDTGVTSVFGESGLVLKPILGSGSAAELDHANSGGGNARSAAIYVNAQTDAGGDPILTYLAANDGDTTGGGALDTAATYISADANIDNAVAIDLDNDGTEDYIIAAATAPFYIRDHTFTRVMTYDATNHGNTFKIASPTAANITTTDAIGTTVDNINAVADAGAATDTAVYGAVTNVNDIVFVSAQANANNFNIIDDIDEDYLKDTTSTADIAKGAVKDVYSLNYLAKHKIVPHKVEIKLTHSRVDVIDEDDDQMQVSINGGSLSADITDIEIVNSTATKKAMFDALVSTYKDQIKAANLDATVTHNYDEATDNIDDAVITIEGYDITTAKVKFTDNNNNNDDYDFDGTDANSATAGKLDNPVADLTADLKYNAIYTPDFAKDGPLYTLKDLGYTAQAMVTGNTNMSAGTVAWENIDLTRKPSEWFKNADGTIHNDYNLFNIDGKAGYWTYLVPNPGTNPLSISDVTIRPTYVHHFNNDNTTINHVAATIQLTVHGLPTDTSSVSVYANVGGSNVELLATSSDGVYSASLTSYEVQNLVAGGNRDIVVSVADGLGYRLNSINIGSIDFNKPDAPVVDLKNGTNVAISSDSNDTSGFYIYNVSDAAINSIPEENTEASSNKVAKILEANATSYNLCADADAFGTEYIYRAIAVDGTVSSTSSGSDAELRFGNASDATEFTFSAIHKGASVLVNTQGVDSSATDLASTYSSSCVATADTEDAGISVKSIKADKTVKISYIKNPTVHFSTDTPLTIYVGLSNDGLAEIKYVPAYGGSKFYIEFDGVVYSGTLPTDDNTNGTSSTALDVSGSVVTGQAL